MPLGAAAAEANKEWRYCFCSSSRDALGRFLDELPVVVVVVDALSFASRIASSSTSCSSSSLCHYPFFLVTVLQL